MTYQTMAQKPNPTCFLYNPQTKNSFYMFKWLGKEKNVNIIWTSNFSVYHKAKILLPSHLHVFMALQTSRLE